MPGTPYGRGPYGKGPYAFPGNAGRPYGYGKYGTGRYSRWGANVFAMQARTGLVFDAKAASSLAHQPAAASSITFGVLAFGVEHEVNVQAITEIVFATHGALVWSWSGWQPCETGAWASAVPCEDGGWAAPAGCSIGSWNLVRLV